jgi:hypothetical protein
MFVVLVLFFSIGVVSVSTAKPPKTVLDVTVTSPADGLGVVNGGFFEVTGSITAKRGDAGNVRTFVQYAVGEGSTDFRDMGGTDPSVLHISTGNQPQTHLLLKDQSYTVGWTLTGPAGTYEIRIRSEGDLAKPGVSESVTVRILAEPPPPGVVVVSSEEQDPATGYGVSTGSYENTFNADGSYEILSEEKNRWGTKKPVDDTTELGWILTFNLPAQPTSAVFYFYGFSEFPEGDSDASFSVQEDVGGTWNTILEISHTGINKMLFAPVTDLGSPSISLRFVDNDRTVGNKEISSLHIDQAFIGVDDYQPPMSGVEILTTPYTCHRFQAWEHYGIDWYHDADIPLTSAAATDIEIVDLDFDGRNEIVVAEVISETHGVGIVEIFDLDYGTSPIDTLVLPEEFSAAVTSIAVGNFDDDADLEIAGTTSFWGGAVIWDKVDGTYEVGLMLKDTSVIDLVTAGNLDGDPELEIVFAISWDPVLPEVALYDYDRTQKTWINTANYSSFFNTVSDYRWFYHIDIDDVDNDNVGELYVLYAGGSFRTLSYTDGELVDFWTTPDVAVGADVGFSFVTGDVTNNGFMDIVFYSPFLDTGTGFRVFEYDILQGFVNTYNISNPGMINIFGDQMAIGDVDGDLMNELVVSGGPGGIYSEGRLYIFRNDTLIFTAELNANESNCVVIGDYDNDA